jgi:hypothetical protein
MNSFARAFVSVLLLTVAGLAAGCSAGNGLLETGSTSYGAETQGAYGAGPQNYGAPPPRADQKMNWDEFWKEMQSRGSQ